MNGTLLLDVNALRSIAKDAFDANACRSFVAARRPGNYKCVLCEFFRDIKFRCVNKIGDGFFDSDFAIGHVYSHIETIGEAQRRRFAVSFQILATLASFVLGATRKNLCVSG